MASKTGAQKNKPQKTFVLLDSHALIHRAFHALPALTNEKGEQLGAVYGFATILLRILDELKPDYLVAAFDMPGPTFRHTAFERYKAQRPAAPDELIGQFKQVRRLARAFDIPVLEKEGYEADDIIGTVVEEVSGKYPDMRVVIVTGDLDTLQLVRPNVFVYTLRKGVTDTITYDEKAVRARYGLSPASLTDFKGLRGDPSDNIPGVKGIGEKTASELLKKYGTIEKLYASLSKAKLSPSVRQKLETQKEEALFSKALSTINCEVPITFSLKEAAWGGVHGIAEVESLFREFGFNSLLRRLGYARQEVQREGGLFAAPAPAQIRREFSRELDLSREKELGFFTENEDIAIATSREIYWVPHNLRQHDSFARTVRASRIRVFFDEKQFLRASKIFSTQPTDFDILIAVYLLRAGERSYTLERAAREAAIPAAGNEAYRKSFDISRALEKRLRERSLWKIFSEIEMPIVAILAGIEERGMLLDVGFLRRLSREMVKTQKKFEADIYRLAGREFNINSPKQVSDVLFGVLKLASGGIRKTEGGAISTDAGELAKLKDAHPVVGKILEYREIAKLLGTYVDALPQLVSRENTLHTSLNQTLTSTGRLSSSNPNLQNIPTRTEFGRRIRKAFIARKGFLLVSFDYSQIELRVAAAMSGDEKMKAAFLAGQDIHALTAMEVNNLKTPEEVTPDMRYAAKALNFGILYGMGPRAFAESAGVPYAEARRFMAEYFNDFPRIKRFMDTTLERARQTGYVETMLGRRRYLPEINSPNFRVRAEAERMAMNAPIQGTATGDIVKLAMIAVDRYFSSLKKDAGHILMQVHDELLCEIRIAEVNAHAMKIKKLMEEVYDIGVPLVVEVKSGPNWGEMKKVSK